MATTIITVPEYTVHPSPKKSMGLGVGYVNCAAYHFGGKVDRNAYLWVRQDGKIEVHTRWRQFQAEPHKFGVAWVTLSGCEPRMTDEGDPYNDIMPTITFDYVRVGVPRRAWAVACLYAARVIERRRYALTMGPPRGELPPAPPPPPTLRRVEFPRF
jgi:hypothetical protein